MVIRASIRDLPVCSYLVDNFKDLYRRRLDHMAAEYYWRMYLYP